MLVVGFEVLRLVAVRHPSRSQLGGRVGDWGAFSSRLVVPGVVLPAKAGSQYCGSTLSRPWNSRRPRLLFLPGKGDDPFDEQMNTRKTKSM